MATQYQNTWQKYRGPFCINVSLKFYDSLKVKCGCFYTNFLILHSQEKKKVQNGFSKSIKRLKLLYVLSTKVGELNGLVLSHDEECKLIYSDSE